LPLRGDHWMAGLLDAHRRFAMSALRRLQPAGMRKQRSFADGLVNASDRPEAALRGRPCERAKGARKRPSAERVARAPLGRSLDNPQGLTPVARNRRALGDARLPPGCAGRQRLGRILRHFLSRRRDRSRPSIETAAPAQRRQQRARRPVAVVARVRRQVRRSRRFLRLRQNFAELCDRCHRQNRGLQTKT
jgi:hypothetical protein